MPVMNGSAATHIISERFPDVKVLVVKSHITSIFNRLNLKKRAQVAIYANSILG